MEPQNTFPSRNNSRARGMYKSLCTTAWVLHGLPSQSYYPLHVPANFCNNVKAFVSVSYSGQLLLVC